MVAEPFAVEAFGIDGAVFTAEPDPETNFTLSVTRAECADLSFGCLHRPRDFFVQAVLDAGAGGVDLEHQTPAWLPGICQL